MFRRVSLPVRRPEPTLSGPPHDRIEPGSVASPTHGGLNPDAAITPVRGQHIEATPETLECHIGCEWVNLGNAQLDYDSRPMFPRTADVPAIYRFFIRRHSVAVYVGETERLARRLSHYRNPGLTQQTNRRLRAILVEALRSGGEIVVSAITSAWIDRGLGREALDLAKATSRRLVENAVIVSQGGSEIESLNLP